MSCTRLWRSKTVKKFEFQNFEPKALSKCQKVPKNRGISIFPEKWCDFCRTCSFTKLCILLRCVDEKKQNRFLTFLPRDMVVLHSKNETSHVNSFGNAKKCPKIVVFRFFLKNGVTFVAHDLSQSCAFCYDASIDTNRLGWGLGLGSPRVYPAGVTWGGVGG